MARPRTSSATSSSHAFKQLSVGELVALDTIKPEPKVRPETPRQRGIHA